MIISTLNSLPGKEIRQHFGIVSGSTVRAKNVFKDFGAGIKNLFGGELKTYSALLNEAREEAMERMIAQAKDFGANAIYNVRFSTSSITAGASEIYVYGTAVEHK